VKNERLDDSAGSTSEQSAHYKLCKEILNRSKGFIAESLYEETLKELLNISPLQTGFLGWPPRSYKILASCHFHLCCAALPQAQWRERAAAADSFAPPLYRFDFLSIGQALPVGMRFGPGT
jgi:hypothetical protein